MSRFAQRMNQRLGANPEFAAGFDEGIAEFNLAQELDQAREERGMSKTDLALSMGRERAFVSRKLNHPQNMEIETLTLFLHHLGKRADIVIKDARSGTPTLRIVSGRTNRTGAAAGHGVNRAAPTRAHGGGRSSSRTSRG